MSKFFQFDQINVGGSFITDDNVFHLMFIEADSVEEAVQKAESLGGDRWYNPWNDGESYPMEYGNIVFNSVEEHAQYLANGFGWTSPDIRIFYADGTVREVFTERVS
jgi:hypothetical protein